MTVSTYAGDCPVADALRQRERRLFGPSKFDALSDEQIIEMIAEDRRLDNLEAKMPGLSLKTKERAEDILEVLEGDPLTTDEIAVLLDGKHKTNHLATTLKQLVKIGIVQGRLDDAPSPRDRRLVWWRESRD